jgi:hypothetical protein
MARIHNEEPPQPPPEPEPPPKPEPEPPTPMPGPPHLAHFVGRFEPDEPSR